MIAKPGVVDRFRIAWRVFQNGFPRRALEQKAKGGPYSWPTWREQVPQWRTDNFRAYIEEAFNRNPLLYSAIMYKARSKMSAPLRAYGGDPQRAELLPVDHPLSQLVARPNPYQSGVEFHQTNEIYYNLGDSFILFNRPRGGGVPEAMYGLRSDRVYIIPGEGGIKGYLYVPEGRSIPDGLPVLPQDMMHVKLPNPADELEGFGYGRLPPVGQSIDVDNDVTSFLKLFFQNGAMLMGVLKFDVPLDDDVVADVKARWMDMYGGMENWTEVGVLDRGGDYQRLGATFDEMGFGEIDERNESRILGPLGVPPILIGTRIGLKQATKANYAEARQSYWEDTAIPEQTLFESNYQYYLRSEDGGFVRFDRTKVPALQKDVPKLTESAFTLWRMGVPANQALKAVGMDIGEVPGGDIGYVPANVLPGGVMPEEAEETSEGAIEAEGDDRKGRPGRPGRKADKEPFIPLGAEDPLPPLPEMVTIDDEDIEQALEAWNRIMPEAVGLLAAGVKGEDGTNGAAPAGE